jgi:hypothetical protein
VLSVANDKAAFVFAVRTGFARIVKDHVRRLAPRPSPSAFVDAAVAREYESTIARVLAQDPILRHFPESGPVKLAARATRMAQFVVVGACHLAGAKLPNTLVSTFSRRADTAEETEAVQRVTSALGVSETATLRETYVSVRARLGLDPPLSAVLAGLDKDDGDVDAEDATANGGSGGDGGGGEVDGGGEYGAGDDDGEGVNVDEGERDAADAGDGDGDDAGKSEGADADAGGAEEDDSGFGRRKSGGAKRTKRAGKSASAKPKKAAGKGLKKKKADRR